VRKGGVGGDDQIEVHHERRGVHEGPGSFIQAATQVEDRKLARQGTQLVRARSFLQTDELNAGHAGKGREVRQGNGTLAIAAVGRCALPGNANEEVRCAMCDVRC